ncbi:MAG: M18 family aminopeptidase, partial [Lachnospiraceae bacterium]
MTDFEKCNQELLQFIEESPSAFHAVRNLKRIVFEKGYQELQEAEDWQLKAGGRYFVTRNDSSIVAFSIPADGFGAEPDTDCCTDGVKGFHIVAAHSDSPTFKVKEKPEMKVEDKYVKLNTEKYGGMIMNTWLDRPLSVAGRITLKE